MFGCKILDVHRHCLNIRYFFRLDAYKVGSFSGDKKMSWVWTINSIHFISCLFDMCNANKIQFRTAFNFLGTTWTYIETFILSQIFFPACITNCIVKICNTWKCVMENMLSVLDIYLFFAHTGLVLKDFILMFNSRLGIWE